MSLLVRQFNILFFKFAFRSHRLYKNASRQDLPLSILSRDSRHDIKIRCDLWLLSRCRGRTNFSHFSFSPTYPHLHVCESNSIVNLIFLVVYLYLLYYFAFALSTWVKTVKVSFFLHFYVRKKLNLRLFRAQITTIMRLTKKS